MRGGSLGGSAGRLWWWRRKGTAIAGATAAPYATPPATYADQGAHYSVTSSAATLSLVASANPQAFESVALAPSAGRYLFRGNLNLSGPQTNAPSAPAR